MLSAKSFCRVHIADATPHAWPTLSQRHSISSDTTATDREAGEKLVLEVGDWSVTVHSSIHSGMFLERCEPVGVEELSISSTAKDILLLLTRRYLSGSSASS